MKFRINPILIAGTILFAPVKANPIKVTIAKTHLSKKAPLLMTLTF